MPVRCPRRAKQAAERGFNDVRGLGREVGYAEEG
jgi:hypothetical protein